MTSEIDVRVKTLVLKAAQYEQQLQEIEATLSGPIANLLLQLRDHVKTIQASLSSLVSPTSKSGFDRLVAAIMKDRDYNLAEVVGSDWITFTIRIALVFFESEKPMSASEVTREINGDRPMKQKDPGRVTNRHLRRLRDAKILTCSAVPILANSKHELTPLGIEIMTQLQSELT